MLRRDVLRLGCCMFGSCSGEHTPKHVSRMQVGGWAPPFQLPVGLKAYLLLACPCPGDLWSRLSGAFGPIG
eukprot:2309555-Amphidinium_carterae.3